MSDFGHAFRRPIASPSDPLKRLAFIGSPSGFAISRAPRCRPLPGQFGFEIVRHPLAGLEDVEGAVAASVRDGVDAICISGESLLYNNMARMLPLVTAPGKPMVNTYPEWGRAGLLMSNSADLIDVRRAGTAWVACG